MADRIVRVYQAPEVIGFSVSTIYNLLNPSSQYFDPSFPKPVKIGSRAKGFRLSELEAWIASRDMADG